MDYVRRYGVAQAQKIAALAKDAGHDLSVHHNPPPPEFPRGNHKWWVTCSCGWEGRKWAAKSGALTHAINHMASKAAEEDIRQKSERNGGRATERSVEATSLPPIGPHREVTA